MRVLAYSSATTFGGHEVMSLKGLRSLLLAGHQVVLHHPATNEKMRMMCQLLLSDFSQLFSTVETQSQARRLQIFFTWLDLKTLLRLRNAFSRSDADVVLDLQGDIEQGSEAIVAAALANKPIVSYIPMVLTGRQRGIRFARARDILSKPLYRLATEMIVISPTFERSARDLGVSTVHVVYNCIDTTFLKEPSRRIETRSLLGIRTDERISGFVGRISYEQKGIDRLVAILKADVSFFAKNRMLIVGSGPDDERLASELRVNNLEPVVIRMPWNDERFAYFDCMDVFLCVSRFEGIPLTVLEASARKVPVLSMPLPTLVDHLPLHYLSAEFDSAECVRKIMGLTQSVDIAQAEVCRLVERISAPATFELHFERAVSSAAKQQQASNRANKETSQKP